VWLAGHLAHIRVQVGLRDARLGIARAHLTEVLVRRDPGRAVGRLENAEHLADIPPACSTLPSDLKAAEASSRVCMYTLLSQSPM
jgi:hypothetical protein